MCDATLYLEVTAPRTPMRRASPSRVELYPNEHAEPTAEPAQARDVPSADPPQTRASAPVRFGRTTLYMYKSRLYVFLRAELSEPRDHYCTFMV